MRTSFLLGLRNGIELTPGKKCSRFPFNFHFLEGTGGTKASLDYPYDNPQFTIMIACGESTLSATIRDMGDTIHDVAHVRVTSSTKLKRKTSSLPKANMEVILGEKVPELESGFKVQALIKIQGENIGYGDDSGSEDGLFNEGQKDKCTCCCAIL